MEIQKEAEGKTKKDMEPTDSRVGSKERKDYRLDEGDVKGSGKVEKLGEGQINNKLRRPKVGIEERK